MLVPLLIVLSLISLLSVSSWLAVATSASPSEVASRRIFTGGKSAGLSETGNKLKEPLYTPKLPPAAYIDAVQKKLGQTCTHDWQQYFKIAEPSDFVKVPCSLLDCPLTPWKEAEKADLIAIIERILTRSPGLIINAAHGRKIYLCSTATDVQATAVANPGLLLFDGKKFFMYPNQYHIFCHELVHLSDTEEMLSDSKAWHSIVDPIWEKAQKLHERAQQRHFVGIKDYQAQLIGLQSIQACSNELEALADNAARYLTTGDILLGGDAFLYKIIDPLIVPNPVDLKFRELSCRSRVLAHQEKFREAIALACEASKLHPENSHLRFLKHHCLARALFEESVALFENGPYAAAVKTSDQAIRLLTEEFDYKQLEKLLKMRYSCELKERHFTLAAQVFETAEYWQRNGPSMASGGDCFSQASTNRLPPAKEAKLAQARRLLTQKKPGKALAICNSLPKDRQYARRVQYLKISAYEMSGNEEAARKEVEKLVQLFKLAEIDPDDVKFYLH